MYENFNFLLLLTVVYNQGKYNLTGFNQQKTHYSSGPASYKADEVAHGYPTAQQRRPVSEVIPSPMRVTLGGIFGGGD